MSLFAAILLIVSFNVSAEMAGPNDSSIILIGDTGKDTQGQLDVSLSIQELCSREKCDLGILAGDNVYPVGVKSKSDPILETMFDKYYNPINLRFLVALGNHDYGPIARDWKRGSYQVEHSKKNPAFYLPHYWYQYETASAVFAVIDTSRLMWRKDVKVQAKMVEAAAFMAKIQNKWFIVIGHHPYLSNGKHGNAGRYERLRFPYPVSGSNMKAFLDNHVCGKAHFYFSGHDHNLQVIDGNIAKCNTQLLVSGSAASGTTLTNRNKTDFQTSNLGYFQVKINQEEVRIKAIDATTTVLFEKSYLK